MVATFWQEPYFHAPIASTESNFIAKEKKSN
jgi:hypothetical protein